jgi:hypothetical protein
MNERFVLTTHAAEVVVARAIRVEWIEQTLKNPQLNLPDPEDPELERLFRCIPEYGNRVLRVVVNRTVDPLRVVSVFFDRGMKGKL